ncbi:DUF5709 domain-containing protein [Nonomuraea ferruginea]|uniref:DUF5709 domain-containing protein n=1 Tax=Nonomuraea ferruginea TaxID=46174 RepID=A0ABT4T109_9ACTN|nr:DUF5709 domain-containing protein [Nonomuraea ferruginea]MDA0642949.1 DUF5709 domain-containing protein [Nonomuraea ferruginea]
MTEHIPEHDPRSRFEDEGIPDLQDGTPEQQWAEDPQEAPLPADHPTAVDDFGTTVDEQIRGEPLEGRLEREVPEEEASFGTDTPVTVQRAPSPDPDEQPLTDEGGLGVGSDLDTDFQQDSGVDEGDYPDRAGRLVAADEGAHPDTEPDEVARDVGPDADGYSAEESAMRVEPE